MAKNTFGNSVTITIFGESHGAEIGAVLDGLAPGIPVKEEFIAEKLSLRRPAGAISTGRVEPDRFRIVSGVFEGRTTGTAVCILIPNENTRSKDYSATRFLARPGHADYTANCKYHGYEDYRGGGHFSGRVTAALVAAGAIALSALEGKGILIGTHIARCAGVADRGFAGGAGFGSTVSAGVGSGSAVSAGAGSGSTVSAATGSGSTVSAGLEVLNADIRALSASNFAVLDPAAAAMMRAEIERAAAEGDSVGGILETAVTGLPAGVGEPWFDSLESVLSHALFSIPAVKGVEFGDGFALADLRGSTANDSFRMSDGTIVTATNRNGGINGGISNGMPLIFRCAVKPTPSIFKEQDTVDFSAGTDEKLLLKGRHDPAIVHRARIVVDSVCALVLCDMLAQRFGTDFLGPEG